MSGQYVQREGLTVGTHCCEEEFITYDTIL